MSQEPQERASTSPPAVNELKRKTPPVQEDHKPIILPPGANLPAGEYEAGRVICEVCGAAVQFRDDPAGPFTLKYWDAHRLTCGTPPQSQAPPPVIFTPLSDVHSLGPPAKRRRAKRTEEERIEYLRADAHVAQFEAYRVLCASCDKWIRLRPNSTYCSIPWDAHRKSCLAKKSNANAKNNVYALGERNALFAKDPDVRKFDSERLLCGMCDKWLAMPPDDLGAVQLWLQHRESCQKTSEERKPVVTPPPTAGPSPPSASASAPRPAHHSAPPPPPPHHPGPQHPPHPHHPHRRSPYAPPPPPPHPPTHLPLPDAPHLLLDLSPTNYAAPHESRRRNAEQRAATLRGDVLIRDVEPNRVFCSLCAKWVQLRQDSSYCAYPWLQHRGKCLARYQRRAQKANEIAAIKGGKRGGAGASVSAPPRALEEHDEPESEEGVDAGARRRPAPPQHPPRAHAAARPMREWVAHQHQHQHQHQQQQQQQDDGDVDADGEDVDADGDSYMEDEGATPTRAYYSGNATANGNSASAILRRAVPATLADLDSPGGRRAFVFASVEYLFRTTYEASDDMSVSALLAYLNAAMPADKHEDFDTGEVARAAGALAAREKERFALEGDMLRLLRDAA
ncbi:hypothetical protein DFH07DRAFT_871080 [Mycena maculata]|uniref:Uncharacterized protein n=1 Tax=Mycena maculata TaxID=230809 RepID=A0AAD7MVF8_9AGAR|nr:hypothetical protein DFH07DRAFT_871080 [Mycena maculata]